ncbi:hypothetical protein GCM10017688_19850 [Streptomyces ramulosus]
MLHPHGSQISRAPEDPSTIDETATPGAGPSATAGHDAPVHQGLMARHTICRKELRSR